MEFGKALRQALSGDPPEEEERCRPCALRRIVVRLQQMIGEQRSISRLPTRVLSWRPVVTVVARISVVGVEHILPRVFGLPHLVRARRD